MPSTLELPVLDLANTTVEELAKQFKYAGETTGFLQIVNHGVPDNLLKSGFDFAKKFFELPIEEKLKVKRDPYTARGYLLVGGQVLAGSLGSKHEGEDLIDRTKEAVAKGDQKEAFTIGLDTLEGDKMHGRYYFGTNLLPSEELVPGLSQFVKEYTTTLWKLQNRMINIAALSLEQGQDAKCGLGSQILQDAIMLIRLQFYPATQEKDVVGAGAHTDFGFTTLLATSGEPGLEVYYKGAWHAVEPAPNSFIVNIGDCLARLSGGKYKSALHRVLNSSGKPRYSIPCFLEGNPDFTLRPVDTPSGSTDDFPTVEQIMLERHKYSYPTQKTFAK